MSEDLLRQKLFALVTAAAWHDPAEAQNRYNFLREQRVPDYIFIPAADFMRALSQRSSRPALSRRLLRGLTPCCERLWPAMWAVRCSAWARSCPSR